MSRRYEGRGTDIADIMPVISLVIALLAVVAAAYFYIDSKQYRTSNDFALARATVRADQLESKLRALETALNDTRTSVQQTVNATASAAVGQAVTREVNKALDANPAIGRTNVSQSWTEPQTFAMKGSTGSISIEGATVEGRSTAIQWKIGDTVRNRIMPGTVNFGDEVIIGAPGFWDHTVPETMLNVASDLTPQVPASTPVVAIRDHWNGQGILVLGQDGAGAPLDRPYQGDWRMGLYTDRLLFGPPGYNDSSRFTTGIARGADGQLLLFSNGGQYVDISPEYTRVFGNFILDNRKTTPGDPSGLEGMMYINLADNAVKMFVEGAWRTLASW